MKTKKSRSKRKGTVKVAAKLSARETAELSNVLKTVDVKSSSARILTAIKSSPRFLKSTLERGGKIRLVAESGYLGIHPPAKLRQIALQAS